MSDKSESKLYYVVQQSLDGGDKFEVREEVWRSAYGDSLVNTKVVKTGTATEVEQYLKDNNITEVITKGL